MGRGTWSTPEQLEYLEQRLPGLDAEKAGNGLKQFYTSVARDFAKLWPPPVLQSDFMDNRTPAAAEAVAYSRRERQISDWFKNARKRNPTPSKPKPVLDLSGKNSRRPLPLQLHQAYSVRFSRPEESPLRKEVDDLWKRRKSPDVVQQLTPFMLQAADFNNRMLFHNGVMRQKVSLLTVEERLELQAWIDEETQTRINLALRPWEACLAEGEDKLMAENQYIQSIMNVLPSTLQVALEEVERTTGMKAILLVGGPIPAHDGKIGTHLYVTGRSRTANLPFSKAWEGYQTLHDNFVHWLRTTYSEEEISRRSGYSTHVMNAVPPRLDISDPTVAEESNQEESVDIKEPSALKEPAAEESTGDEQPASINTTTTPEVTAVPQIPGPAGDTPPPLAAEGTHDHSSSTPLDDSHQSPPSSPENDRPSLSLPAPNPEEQD
ncbi:hypothetical protein BJ322DRAFT_1114895 [Thelephora terrestris]|uniref:Uncharacterized protein n=1 Tax=Thelephora terrestris TaxID=56493 RepID=A0A9P6L0T3_9AGAM|nr:hypothetical protein BJ322DRAFT_1114895 [Thelephora terrestris]